MDIQTTGRIETIESYGSIITVALSLENGKKRTLYFDRTPFFIWFKDTGKDHPFDLIGMQLDVMDEPLTVGLPY